ncbi:MAG: GNAT family N-acetyltransferase [Halioglobus sp.]|nr:GNAT family N-acetyltransferase [Halioglobus sp.]
MNINLHDQPVTPELMDLLLLADPDRNAVLGYITDSTILVCQAEGTFTAVAVLKRQGDIAELKNIAVLPPYQGRGIAKALITEVLQLATRSGARIVEVGTGNSSLSQLALYQKCGFRMHCIDTGYFDSYPEPIFETGIRCRDRVRLRVTL